MPVHAQQDWQWIFGRVRLRCARTRSSSSCILLLIGMHNYRKVCKFVIYKFVNNLMIFVNNLIFIFFFGIHRKNLYFFENLTFIYVTSLCYP